MKIILIYKSFLVKIGMTKAAAWAASFGFQLTYLEPGQSQYWAVTNSHVQNRAATFAGRGWGSSHKP
jgi:hypothetical protein